MFFIQMPLGQKDIFQSLFDCVFVFLGQTI